MGIVNQHLAQKIVLYIVRIVGRTVNIMDEQGVIIASSDPVRVGQYHGKALDAIRNNRAQIVNADGDGMKQGINVPLHYHDQICGVVGVSGDVEEIRPIIDLVRCSVELLIEQEVMMNLQQVRKQMREQFLYEWVYRQVACSPDFVSRGENCDVLVKVPRTLALVRLDKFLPNNLLEDHFESSGDDVYCIRLSSSLHILILRTQQFETRFADIFRLAPNAKISVGEPSEIIHTSLLQAQSAMNIGEVLFPDEALYVHERFGYFDLIMRNRGPLNSAANKFENTWYHKLKNTEYLSTLMEYFRQNGQVKLTALKLHIHRNTLKYRLERLRQITGLDPFSNLDLFRLVCDYVIGSISQHTPAHLSQSSSPETDG